MFQYAAFLVGDDTEDGAHNVRGLDSGLGYIFVILKKYYNLFQIFDTPLI